MIILSFVNNWLLRGRLPAGIVPAFKPLIYILQALIDRFERPVSRTELRRCNMVRTSVVRA
jgi:hypothetical protein